MIPIGFLRHNFLGRSETFIYNSMRGLEDAGRYHVRVFALRRLLAEQFPWADVTCPSALGRIAYKLTRIAPVFRRWARSVRLVHAHFGQASPFAMASGVPFVVSYYGHDVVLYRTRERFEAFAWWYTLLRRRVFARAARVIALSDHMKRALVDQGCPEAKIAIVRLGVDLERFAVPRSPGTGALRVLMVGREVDKKGFDDGLRACHLLRARGVDCTVTVLGTDGPLAHWLRVVADDLELDATWLDPATPTAAAMADADVLLVPSRRADGGDEEGTPTVIAEAGAARLPVVSTRHAGIPEMIDDGATGLLAGERDPHGLADALHRLARDRARRLAIGDAARAKISRDYSLAAHRARLEDLYGAVLEDVR